MARERRGWSGRGRNASGHRTRERNHNSPHLLPGGKAAVFSIGKGSAPSELAALRLDDRKIARLGIDGENPRYVSSGRIMFERADASVLAVPFDPRSLRITGPTIAVLENVIIKGGGSTEIGVSRNGTLASLPGNGTAAQLVVVDRQGRSQPLRQDLVFRRITRRKEEKVASRMNFSEQQRQSAFQANAHWLREYGVTGVDLALAFEPLRQRGQVYYCENCLFCNSEQEYFDIDHLVPDQNFRIWGKHVEARDAVNMVVLCKSRERGDLGCNQSKGANLFVPVERGLAFTRPDLDMNCFPLSLRPRQYEVPPGH